MTINCEFSLPWFILVAKPALTRRLYIARCIVSTEASQTIMEIDTSISETMFSFFQTVAVGFHSSEV